MFLGMDRPASSTRYAKHPILRSKSAGEDQIEAYCRTKKDGLLILTHGE